MSEKNHTTSSHTKIMKPLSKIHRKNSKTLSWEHHIGFQMCQIALSKNIKRVKKKKVDRVHDFLCRGYMILITNVKKLYTCINFLSTFRKSNLTYLTTDVMFSGQRFAILAMCIISYWYNDVSGLTNYTWTMNHEGGICFSLPYWF